MDQSVLLTAENDKNSKIQTAESKQEGAVANGESPKSFTSVTKIEITETVDDNTKADDLVILRRDPSTRRSFINKSAYAKLHRTLSPGRNNTIGDLREKYEGNRKPDLIDVKSETNKKEEIKENGDSADIAIFTSKRTTPIKLDDETVQSLKNKYSPASFGYPKPQKNSKLPVPKIRSTVKSEIILPSSKPPAKNKLRYSQDVGRKRNPKDENSNEVNRKNSSSSGEFITIITRSESEASVDKFEKELNLFTMDQKKEKKKTNGFKKIFSGKLFGGKKKKEEEKNRVQYKESAVYSDNIQNETNAFNRKSPYRHTTDGSNIPRPKQAGISRSDSERFSNPKKIPITKEMEEKYAQMHVSQFNHIKHSFEQPDSASPPVQGYVRMDKPIVKNNPGPTSHYMNMPNVKRYIDTSSSNGTLESDQSQNTSQRTPNTIQHENEIKITENDQGYRRNTPPRALELQQNLRLVNPKALIPINSERQLPNPYQNNSLPRNPTPGVKEGRNRTRFDETYGTVFDSIQQVQLRNNAGFSSNSPKPIELKVIHKPPRSPSLESSKLKLPPKREIIPLSPRMKSPIPHDRVSTEKLIATELLKPIRSPTSTRKTVNNLSSSSQQKLEIETDFPSKNERNETNQPNMQLWDPSGTNTLDKYYTNNRYPSTSDNKRLSGASPSSDIPDNFQKYNGQISSAESREKITTNAMIHANLPNVRSPTPNSLLHNRSLSPMRPQSVRSSTPVDMRSPSTKGSPQKDDMRKSVEAYYWKEIKKLKDQENFDLYLYQMQVNPYGYADDPVSVRRSRSLSPTTNRNSRRSFSLPREPNPPGQVIENPYGRMRKDVIPEGRAVINGPVHQRNDNIIYGQLHENQSNFRRSAPERRTIDSIPRTNQSIYKPIFKRGSLTTPVSEYSDDLQNKKVSFSSSRKNPDDLRPWPTRNGFTQSPPQRRVDSNRTSTIDDDVFLPTTPRNQTYGDNTIYTYGNKPPNLYDYNYNPEEVIYQQRQLEPIYGPVRSSVRRYPQTPEESLYADHVNRLNVQMQDPIYGQRQLLARRTSYDNVNLEQRRSQEPQYINREQVPVQVQRDPRYGYKREIIVTDEIFGQFGGYLPPNSKGDNIYFRQNRPLPNSIYESRQSIAEPVYGRSGPRQVTVKDKVCDIYGQIHDRDSPSLVSNQIQKSGILVGELQRNPGWPKIVRVPSEQFVRNTRLTASTNDMYRRYQNNDPRYRSDVVYGGARLSYQDGGAPNRPLPPVPNEKKYSNRFDMENVSDADDVQKILSGTKNKKRSFFGK